MPANERVLLCLSSANRDPRTYENPDRVDLSRPNIKDHLSFGGGRHVCIGMALARLEIKIVIETILQSYSKIDCPEDENLDWNYSVFMRFLNTLPMRFS